MIRRMTTLTALALVAASGAWAQTARQGTSGATAAPAPAGQVDTTRSACLRGLDQMAVQMDEDGYWLTGWRGTVADPAMPPAVVPGAGPATGGPAAAGGTGAGATAPAAGAARPVGPGAAGGPWGDQTWTASRSWVT
jgi:glutathione S-transferase